MGERQTKTGDQLVEFNIDMIHFSFPLDPGKLFTLVSQRGKRLLKEFLYFLYVSLDFSEVPLALFQRFLVETRLPSFPFFDVAFLFQRALLLKQDLELLLLGRDLGEGGFQLRLQVLQIGL